MTDASLTDELESLHKEIRSAVKNGWLSAQVVRRTYAGLLELGRSGALLGADAERYALYRARLNLLLEQGDHGVMTKMQAAAECGTDWRDAFSCSYHCYSARADNRLTDARIFTLYDLCTKTEADLRKLRGFGAKCMKEVKEMLASFEGLRLGMSDAEILEWIGRRVGGEP